jgi:citrate lyase beta subunit
MIPRRSILSVPGHIKKMHHKASKSKADVIMLDLEDSVPIDLKVMARKTVAESIEQIDWGKKILTVRINSLDTPFACHDIPGIVNPDSPLLNALVVPKVNDSCDIHFVSRFLDGLEINSDKHHRISIEASIETAKGMNHISQIAKSSNRLISLVFGIADYTSSIGARLVSISGHGENESSIYPGHRWHFALSRLVMAAKANDLLAIDAPFGNFKDHESLAHSSALSRALGCDGKWAIHPEQLPVINSLFSPLPEDIEKASKILNAYHESPDKGVIAIDGRMVDQATIRLATQISKQAAFIGTTYK